MATYNGAKYLQEQLDSFLHQTLHPDELVVCDDGSSDGTQDILENFRQQAPFAVRLYSNEVNLGCAKNFEKALSLCIGEVIFLSDQDDVWFCDKIKTMTEIMANRPNVYVLQTDMLLVDEEINVTPYTQLGNVLSLGQSRDAFIFGCGTAIRKAWLDVVLPIPAELGGHDNWMHRLALPLGVRGLHDQPLQYYRRHGDNSSNWLASNPVRMTELDTMRAHGLRDATSGWRKELERVKATFARLEESTGTLRSLGLVDRRRGALSELAGHIDSLDARIRSMEIPRLKRWPRVLAMWLRGGYRHFAGWKSAAKDVVRP